MHYQINFSSLFGMFSGGGGDGEEEESEEEEKSWLRSAADWVPVVGSFLGLKDAYQAGDKWGMAFYGVMLVSDFFLAGAIIKGIAKGGIKAFSKNYKNWDSWRKFYGDQSFAIPKQELHHWLWKRNGAKSGSGFAWKMKNQMWNLNPIANVSNIGLSTWRDFERGCF